MINAMKRIISVFILCILTASLFTACAGSDVPPEEAIVGKWKYSLNEDVRELLTGVVNDERVLVDVYYEFNEDGTGSTYSSFDDNSQSFTYVYDGETLSLTMGQNSFDTSCTIDGDSMTIVENGDTVVFKRD